ncbi:MAG: sigma-70 family RNA polymerase sigma factor [Planctomycetota bacterium]
MRGAAEITDAQVASSVGGSEQELDLLLRALAPQVRLMVSARLSATPAQYHAVDEITHLALVGLSEGIPRLEKRTVAGLKAFTSSVVARKVSDFLKGRGGGDLVGPRLRSLDSTVTALSGESPLWQFLSASGISPSSAADRADQFARLLQEVGRLKPDYRDVVTLAFFDQLPTRDIAERMGVSRPAASMLLIRAVKTLRRNLTGSSRLGGRDDSAA